MSPALCAPNAQRRQTTLRFEGRLGLSGLPPPEFGSPTGGLSPCHGSQALCRPERRLRGLPAIGPLASANRDPTVGCESEAWSVLASYEATSQKAILAAAGMSTSLDLGGGLMPSAQLESLLSQMVQGDPEQIRQAEEALTPALSTPAFMLDLLTRLTQSQAAHVRQLAAVLLRRRIGSHWRKLGAANTNRIKATLLQVLATEPE
ncbi:hypothetical protein EMIHUDRAFT_253562, partial [Emiliania huxleyi CCMP1516]|uniref:Importin N-terminal domain-containing protein n=2 Tax=Emiliania huxleyi TaxID=2903 RepID=A0A0D3K6G1_EMIH1